MMRQLASWMLCGLVMGLAISPTTVRAEDDESVCAGETVDELLDKAGKLLDEKKVDDFVANCFSEAALKKLEADGSKALLVEMAKVPDYGKALAGCKGKTKPAADGKTAACEGGVNFEFVDEEWYLAP